MIGVFRLNQFNFKLKIMKLKRFLFSIFCPQFLIKKANKNLDTQDFYEVMQSYRHANMSDQAHVVEQFENVKEWIRKNYSQ